MLGHSAGQGRFGWLSYAFPAETRPAQAEALLETPFGKIS